MPAATRLATLAVGGGALSEKFHRKTKLFESLGLENIKNARNNQSTRTYIHYSPARGEAGRGLRLDCRHPLGHVGCRWRSVV